MRISRKPTPKQRPYIAPARSPKLKEAAKLPVVALLISILALGISSSQALMSWKTMNRSFEASVLQQRISECSRTISLIQTAANRDGEVRVAVAVREGDRAAGVTGIDWRTTIPVGEDEVKNMIEKRFVAGSEALNYITTVLHIYDRSMKGDLDQAWKALYFIVQNPKPRNEVQSHILAESLKSAVQRCGDYASRYSDFFEH
jgi:hypothetical protein